MFARYRRLGWLLTLVVAGWMLTGCQSIDPRAGLLEKTAQDARLSSHQLRVLMNDYVVHYSNHVEQTADQILASTDDPHVRRNALLWKTNGIPACFRAASRSDPLAAYLDTWILAKQSVRLFEPSQNPPLLGPWTHIALARCQEFDQRLRNIRQLIGGHLPLGEPFVQQFANDFPVDNLYFDRESIASRYIDQVRPETKETFELLGRMEENLQELQKLMSIYAEHLPKQARWQTQILLVETSQIETVSRPLRAMTTAAESASQLVHTAEQIPGLVAQERQAITHFAREERIAAFHELEAMRVATVKAVEAERETVLQAVAAERETMIAELAQHLETTLSRTDEISQKRVTQIVDESSAAIHDHAVAAGRQFAYGLIALGSWSLLLVLLIVKSLSQPRRLNARSADTIRITAHRRAA